MSLQSLPLAVALVAAALAPQQPPQPQFPVDAQTGRAIGAHQMSADDVARVVGTDRKFVIIDVREPDSFAKETIKGAINIPLGSLEPRLKEFSKDTLLVFT